MQQILDRYQSGVMIVKVNMSNAQPPEQVQAAFDDAVKAGQDKDRLKSEGEAYANDVIPKARGLAARLEEEANAHRQRVVSQAEGDVSRFKQVLNEYSKAPQVTRDRMYLDTMQQVLSNSTKVVVDQKGGNNLLYLPLDKLMQMTAPPSPAAAATAPATSAPEQQARPVAIEPVPENVRSRDIGRARERESR
jgi:membrane protease subunit HflK